MPRRDEKAVMVPAIDETRDSWAATRVWLLRLINEVTRSPWRVIVVNFRCAASACQKRDPLELAMTPWNFKFGHRSADLTADLTLQFKYSVP
jgi:hypothetical protein